MPKQQTAENSLMDAFPKEGDRMTDGTILVGLYDDNLVFALPEDAPTKMTWDEARDYASNYEGYGYRKGSFRLPDRRELHAIFDVVSNVTDRHWTSEQRRWLMHEGPVALNVVTR